jgi:hypothetical protein
MRITQAAADKIQVDSMDVYLKYRGVNGCKDSLEVFSGFHFHIKNDLQIIEGKYSKRYTASYATTVSFHMISYECLSVEITYLCAIQHYEIICM